MFSGEWATIQDLSDFHLHGPPYPGSIHLGCQNEAIRVDRSPVDEKYRGTVPLSFEPGPRSPQQPSYFFFESAIAGLLTCLSNSACSEGEQSISRRSKSAGCNRMGNLLRAFQGFVYIVGSMIVSVSSRMSWLTRWNRSSTRKWLLCGRPTLSIQVLSSSPTVWTTNVVSSSHLPIE